ncbi:hypothetical protein ACA910_011236 [Epithemia clementina (nom. ined.)]
MIQKQISMVYDVGDYRALEKTSQAFREGAPKLKTKLHQPPPPSAEKGSSTSSPAKTKTVTNDPLLPPPLLSSKFENADAGDGSSNVPGPVTTATEYSASAGSSQPPSQPIQQGTALNAQSTKCRTTNSIDGSSVESCISVGTKSTQPRKNSHHATAQQPPKAAAFLPLSVIVSSSSSSWPYRAARTTRSSSARASTRTQEKETDCCTSVQNAFSYY